ncbi:EF-hand domain-containing protein [Salinicola rhizosphaerae]|uniref:EF-hand domain-containing protein n=1 Tax=Salinicola rhizosphaerae TaxID=1443141 RepID=A0ABQ3EA43_9GAMM|nr:EF-hand domain-containing protein [Salinicola rhizosphaerae]GHB25864.1 hypothetical protein GCM10009038_26220 [Salinicola rhizosphaerae]
MNKFGNGQGRGWYGVVSLAFLMTACASASQRDVVVDRPTGQGVAQVSADNVFDSADLDDDGHLTPLDIERLGLGGDWHTLDANGSGRISRQEFRDQFATPLIQATLTLPGDADNAQPLVSSDYLLPPEPPSQRYQPAPISAPAPASVSVPSNAPILVPVLINDQDAANINQAAQETGQSDDTESSSQESSQ